MRTLLMLALLSAFNFCEGLSQVGSDVNCFSILVGKKASTDGSVLFAHNEDDLNDHNFVDLHKVPRIKHNPGAWQPFLNRTDSLEEVAETYGYFWITGSKYSEEQYLNEWGVALTSNSSQSKVQAGNGKIDHNLRRIVTERARTAREAIHIAGTIVERFGYASSGRVYLIADPNEAYVLEVVNGKLWIAQRVPDDEVAIIPNYYVIDDFQMADTANYLCSPGLVEYAIKNGWYDPHRDGSFNFRRAYCHKNRYDAVWNIGRKWVILNQFSAHQYGFYDDFPFSIKPKKKIDVQALMEALQNHYENSALEYRSVSNQVSPHRRSSLGVTDTLTVCNLYNDYSCITQLRGWLPAAIGNILWIAPRYPCIQPFIPWYYGTTRISPNYEKATYREALENFNNKNRNYIDLYPGHACWVFDEFANRIDSSYSSEIASARDWKGHFQETIFRALNEMEGVVTEAYATDPEGALKVLTDVSNGFAERALRETQQKLRDLKTAAR